MPSHHELSNQSQSQCKPGCTVNAWESESDTFESESDTFDSVRRWSVPRLSMPRLSVPRLGFTIYKSTSCLPRLTHDEVYPWLTQNFSQAPDGNDFLMTGSDADVLRAVHELAVCAGFRPILIHILSGSAKKLQLGKQHRFKTRGPLEFGTLVHHTRHIETSEDITSRTPIVTFLELRERESTSQMYETVTRYKNLHVVSCDKHSDMLQSPDYWTSRMVENARCYATPDFEYILYASLLSVFTGTIMTFTCYYSTRIEDTFLAGFVRHLPSGASIVYIWLMLRYTVLQPLGCADQPTFFYVTTTLLFECYYGLFGSLTFADGRMLGDIPVIYVSVLTHLIVILGFMYNQIRHTSKVTRRTLLWCAATAGTPLACWSMVVVGIIVYLLLLDSYPVLATLFISLGYPALNFMWTKVLKLCHRYCVEYQRESNPRAVKGSRKYGQCLPVVCCLASFWAFTEMGSVIGIFLGGLAQGGKEHALSNAVKNLAVCTMVHIANRTDFVGFLIAKVFKIISGKSADTWQDCWDCIQTDARFAVSYVRFVALAGLFALRGLWHGNWTFRGHDQFAFSEDVFYIYLMAVTFAIFEDITVFWLCRWFTVSRTTLFGEQWQKLSDDPSKHLSIDKVRDKSIRLSHGLCNLIEIFKRLFLSNFSNWTTINNFRFH